jgi:hypothetical protein
MTETSPAGPRTLEDKYPVPPGKTGIMHELCSRGDVPVMWDRNEPDEVAVARKTFQEAKKKGMIAYRAEGKDGHRGEVIRDFDPAAERIILVRQHQGGAS